MKETKRRNRNIAIGALLGFATIATIAYNNTTDEAEAFRLEMPKIITPSNTEEYRRENRKKMISGSNGGGFIISDTGNVYAMGRSDYSGTGNTGSSILATPTKAMISQNIELEDIVSLSSSDAFTVALASDGSVWGTGRGNPYSVSRLYPQHTGGVYFEKLNIPSSIKVELSKKATTYSYGSVDRYGWILSLDERGYATHTNLFGASAIIDIPNVVDISAGKVESLLLNDSGEVYRYNGHSTSNVSKVEGLPKIVAISAGADHYLALSEDGDVWSWGSNAEGQLGNGTRLNSSIPIRVSRLERITDIEAGGMVSFAINSSGEVFSWGKNTDHQLGLSDIPINGNVLFPTKIESIRNVTGLSVSSNTTWTGRYSSIYAIQADGTILTWGNNFNNHLGLGIETSYAPIPTAETSWNSTPDISDAIIIPEKFSDMIYRFITPEGKKRYESGTVMDVEFKALKHKDIETFDFFYSTGDSEDKNNWILIEENVSIESLTPVVTDSGLGDGYGGTLNEVTYKYSWNTPKERIPSVRFIAVPKYKE